MPAERIAMRQVRDVLRLKAAGVSGNEIARRVGVASSTVRLTLKRLAAAGLELAIAGRADRRGAGGAALHRGRQEAGASPARRARLGGGSPRAEAQARHAADPVGRVHRAESRRVSLLALLRAVPGLGVAHLGHDAADPRRRRQAVCRLRRRHGAGDHRPADRQDPAGADLCRGAGRLQLHLCRGELDPGARRLDRRPHPRLRGDRRGAERCWCRTTPRSR